MSIRWRDRNTFVEGGEVVEGKYKIGDRVYLGADSRAWLIIGIQMRPSYDLVCWQYYLGRAVYGDYPISAFGGRCDVDTRGPVREEELETEESRLLRMKQELNKKIADTEKRLEALRLEAAGK